jgi:hypothetical protein
VSSWTIMRLTDKFGVPYDTHGLIGSSCGRIAFLIPGPSFTVRILSSIVSESFDRDGFATLEEAKRFAEETLCSELEQIVMNGIAVPE